MDYKKTVALPQETSFPMRGDLLQSQEQTLRRWQAQSIYHSILEDRRDARPFLIHDGPPYASGQMHLGIGMNKILKDIVAKYHAMNDRRVPFVPGWDCHGLPIELEVLKQLGSEAKERSRSEIRGLCEKYARSYVNQQTRQFQLLGIFADWERPYLTMSPAYEAAVLGVLARMVEKGYVYRDLRPVAWCETCRTVLADAEIEYPAQPGRSARSYAKGGAELGDPHCRRCGGAATQRATPQWFVRLDHREPGNDKTLRERALLEVKVTQWLPASGLARIRGMIETRPDWCISRQRSWGVPIPAFVCDGCGEAVLDPEAIRRVRDLVAEHGSDVWFKRDAGELLPPGFACPQCGGRKLHQGEDILDVWFESGASWQPMLVADHRGSFPADLYVEGSDQHRGWFQLSLLPSLVCRGKAPYHSVLTHGFVLNQERKPMSRSRGDLVTLEEALAEVPADLIRLLFTAVDVTSDVALSRDNLTAAEPQYRTLRNTFRFLLANLADFVPRQHAVHLDDLHPFDLWELCAFHHLIAEVNDNYANYRFHTAVRRLHEHCGERLSKLYFDVLKDRLYCEAVDSWLRRSAQTVLHSILVGLVKMLAPILPYTCEEVWDLTPGHGDCSSVHLSRWPKSDESLQRTRKAQEADRVFSRFNTLREAVKPALEKLREQKTIADDAGATVRLAVKCGLASFLGTASLGDLRDFLRVSEVVEAPLGEGGHAVPALDVRFEVAACPHPECVRCRRHDASCGADAEHPRLCRRCSGVVRRLESVPEHETTSPRSILPAVRPADLAAFLRRKDLRKVALLNEDGVCRPYALHPPSQEVRIVEELQPLADYVNRSPDFRGHAAVLLGLGEHTDVLFGIGIHHLNYGTPLGGTREYAYATTRDMLDNLLRLSWGMSVKNAIAELPHGGGKSIIDTCGWDLKIHRELRREIYRDFGQFTASLFGRYICAEDVGNTTADTREMLYACRHVMCLSQGVGGSGNPSRFTALVAWAAAKAGWKFLTGETSFAGLTIALQGCGNVGSNIVAILIEADPTIGKLLVGDRDEEQIQVIRNLLLKKGKADILEVVSSLDPERAGDSYVERDDEKGKDYVLYAPCDILIPAAVGNVINPDNVPRLGCKLILPIANNVYSDNDAVARALHERGIVDVVENNVNWGGALAAASEILGYDEKNVVRACLEAYDKTLHLLEEARGRGVPPWELIKERASRRVFGEVHPAVRAAREYKFIGDISESFPTWVKERWLGNVVDVEPDHFAELALGLAEGIPGVV